MTSCYTENTLDLDVLLCNGCGTCMDVCPHAVFERSDGRARIADAEACMECGACQLNCPQQAIRVESGVGCAAAMMASAIRGKKEVTCGCG